MRLRVLGTVLFSVVTVMMILGGWGHLWRVWGQTRGILAVGWGVETMGLVMLTMSQPAQFRRMGLGMAWVLIGLGLMWIPFVGTGIVVAFRMGMGAAAIAVIPRVWSNLRQSKGRSAFREAERAREDVL